MKKITVFSPHYEFEIRCPDCDLSSFIDTFDILDSKTKICPHCNFTAEIPEELKAKASSSIPDNYIIKDNKPYEKLYDIFSFSVWRVVPDYDCAARIMIMNGSDVWDYNESQVTAEMLIIQHFIEKDQRIEWADICIELIERYKK